MGLIFSILHEMLMCFCFFFFLFFHSQGYISDKGYDVDLFFDLEGAQGHIYSDVEGHEMMNYLLINGEIKAQDYQVENCHAD